MLELAGINYWAVLVTKYTNIAILKIPDRAGKQNHYCGRNRAAS